MGSVYDTSGFKDPDEDMLKWMLYTNVHFFSLPEDNNSVNIHSGLLEVECRYRVSRTENGTCWPSSNSYQDCLEKH